MVHCIVVVSWFDLCHVLQVMAWPRRTWKDTALKIAPCIRRRVRTGVLGPVIDAKCASISTGKVGVVRSGNGGVGTTCLVEELDLGPMNSRPATRTNNIKRQNKLLG